jgi:hypothetical protein
MDDPPPSLEIVSMNVIVVHIFPVQASSRELRHNYKKIYTAFRILGIRVSIPVK